MRAKKWSKMKNKSMAVDLRQTSLHSLVEEGAYALYFVKACVCFTIIDKITRTETLWAFSLSNCLELDIQCRYIDNLTPSSVERFSLMKLTTDAKEIQLLSCHLSPKQLYD